MPKQFSIVKNMTPEQALQTFGGYTQLMNGQVAVVMPSVPQHGYAGIYDAVKFTFWSAIVFGYGLTKDGAATGLDFTHVLLALDKLKASSGMFDNGKMQNWRAQQAKGGWIHYANINTEELVEEDSCVFQASNMTDVQLAVLAERLRKEFRQQYVLLVTNNGVVLEIK